jgi:hypothetical protein
MTFTDEMKRELDATARRIDRIKTRTGEYAPGQNLGYPVEGVREGANPRNVTEAPDRLSAPKPVKPPPGVVLSQVRTSRGWSKGEVCENPDCDREAREDWAWVGGFPSNLQHPGLLPTAYVCSYGCAWPALAAKVARRFEIFLPDGLVRLRERQRHGG